MKALDPPSERFSRSLQNTRFELNINAKEVKTNHFVQVPIPSATIVDSSTIDNNSSTLSPNGGESYLESPPKPAAETTVSPPKGLYAYGDATISADKLVPMKKFVTKLGASSPKVSPGKKSPTKKDNPLRPPVIDRRALSIPIQQPPPPQPVGPVPAAFIATQNSILFSAKTTTSLLGLQTSTSGSFHSFQDLLTPVASREGKSEVKTEPKSEMQPVLRPEIFNQYSHRPKLNSVDLLSDIGDEIDQEAKEARERAASYESFNERHSIGSFTPHGMSFGVHNFDPPRATTPGAGLGANSNSEASFMMTGRTASPRPTSPTVQLFDFNAMAKNNEPPAPSTLEKQQQGLSLQMKMAYLNATTTNDEGSRKSRPGSRAHSSSHGASRNIPTPVATQVFRVPSALSQEPSFFSSSGDYNPTESMDSLSKIPQLEEGSMAIDTKSNLHMDSEIDVTLASSIHKTVPLVGAQKSQLKQASLRASHSTTLLSAHANPAPAHAKTAGFAGADALTHTEIPSTVAPSLQRLLPPQQLESLQQPHYQDPRFQKNPREVIYKFHGHLLNTTPFPEEIAHLTLHGKSSRLPQYLKVQQEQQQLRYNNKVRVLASMQPQKPSERADLAPMDKNLSVENAQAPVQNAVPKVMDFSDFVVVDTSREPGQDPSVTEGDAMQSERPLTDHKLLGSQVSAKTEMTIRNELGSASEEFIVLDAGDAASVASAASATEGSVAASVGGNSFTNGSVNGGASVTGGSVARSVTSIGRSVSGDGDSMQEGARTSRPASRSLSIRLTPAGGMVEEHNIAINTKSSSAVNLLSLMSDSAPPTAPAPAPAPAPVSSAVNTSSPLVMLVNEGNSNKIAAGFVRAATSSSDANRPSSPPLFQDTLPNTFREEFVVKGAPTGPALKIKTKFSPGRVAYVLNKHSPAAVGSEDEYDGYDDNQSLHSVHSLQNSVPTIATGNYSAITEDGNFSILKSQMSPLPRRPNGFVSADNSHNGINSKYRPRLDSVAGGSSLASEAEPPIAMPYQVHRKVMGWKLTSTLQRRRNLVGMLDLVHSAQERKSHENKHALEPKLAPPLQIPHSLLRTGHGKRTRDRQVPPLGLVHAHMVNVQEAQQQLQETQVMHGFEYSTRLLQDKNFGSNPNLSRSFSATLKTPKTHKNKNALRASTSNLGNLAIQVENMGKYLPSDTPFDSP